MSPRFARGDDALGHGVAEPLHGIGSNHPPGSPRAGPLTGGQRPPALDTWAISCTVTVLMQSLRVFFWAGRMCTRDSTTRAWPMQRRLPGHATRARPEATSARRVPPGNASFTRTRVADIDRLCTSLLTKQQRALLMKMSSPRTLAITVAQDPGQSSSVLKVSVTLKVLPCPGTL